jgi:hypothetical protein
MYCSPGKQSWMMAMLVKFTLRTRDIIRRGGALADIQKLPGLDRFLRMKSEIPNGDTQAMAALEQLLSNGLDALERKFVE